MKATYLSLTGLYQELETTGRREGETPCSVVLSAVVREGLLRFSALLRLRLGLLERTCSLTVAHTVGLCDILPSCFVQQSGLIFSYSLINRWHICHRQVSSIRFKF